MRARRSLLFVPGAEPRKIEKGRGAGADTLLIDLQDGVLPDDKYRARGEVAQALARGGFGDTEVCVRLNGAGTDEFADDVAATAAAGVRSFMLPACERPESVHAAIEHISSACKGNGFAILALVETALGVVNALAIGKIGRVEALSFGHADFALDAGVDPADPSSGILYHARCNLVLAAKAAGTPAIDTVCLAVRDGEIFRRDAAQALALGFDGKLCIHPAQVGIANEVFAPTQEQIDAAARVVEAAAAAHREGRGVFALEGRMIDAPLVQRSERLLERARRLGLLRE